MAAEQARPREALDEPDGGDPIATTAVNAAKQVQGHHAEQDRTSRGSQALDRQNFSGPLWEKLTGVKIKVIESPFAEIYTKAIAEHIAEVRRDRRHRRVAGLDARLRRPRRDRSRSTSCISKYKAQVDPQRLHPLYRRSAKYKGKTWGFFDDGDVWNLYYRKDIFANAEARGRVQGEVQARPSRAAGRGTSSTRPRSSSPTRWRRRCTAAARAAGSATRATSSTSSSSSAHAAASSSTRGR